MLRLRKDLTPHLRRGHPWIYRDALVPPPRLSAGEIVDIGDPKGAFVARGFYDPDGPIAVRVLTRDPDEAIDDAWLARRIRAAVALRELAAAAMPGDARRLLHGEADAVPGLVLDDYAGTFVLRCDGPGAAAMWQPRFPKVLAVLGGDGPVWERGAEGRTSKGRSLRGPNPPPMVVIREGNARFEVDVVHGQKTGFFLDQRPGRRLVAELARGRRLLNLFSYTGGFSVAAAVAGAAHTTSVDIAAPAIRAAAENFRHSGVDPSRHGFVAADVFDFLAAAKQTWDVVVCDPPSFAPSEKALPRAIAAYRSLHAAAARAVAAGGLLVAASCSSHVPLALFRDLVAEGLAVAGRRGRVVATTAAGPDHPVLPAFPEGNYLKLLAVALD
jgi:23S rRNA (cytosine1962-C5)-methyltransferase